THAERVARVEPGRGLRIERLEAPVEGLGPGRPGLRLERGAERRVGRGPREESSEQRAVVEPGAAHQDRPAPSALDGLDRARGLPREARRIVRLVGLDDVDEVMAHRAALLGGGLRGADVHTAIDLARVDAHYLDRPVLAEGHRKARLADPGRTDDRKD